jgi:hypothetical protein
MRQPKRDARLTSVMPRARMGRAWSFKVMNKQRSMSACSVSEAHQGSVSIEQIDPPHVVPPDDCKPKQ